MTKEEKAEVYVFETNGHKWSNNNGEAGDNYGSFIAGYEAAECDNEQMMCKFAEWIIQENHIFESGGLKYTAKTMPELLNLFKESLKQQS